MSTVLEQIDRVCAEFDLAWRRGDPPCLADYASRIDPAARSRLLAALIEVDVDHRRRLGLPVSADDGQFASGEDHSPACDQVPIQRYVDRFCEAWKLGIAPRLEKHIPSDFDPHQQQRLLVELVRIDIEQRWSSEGSLDAWVSSVSATAFPERPVLDDYVARFPILGASSELPDELILHEYTLRCRRGKAPLDEEYQARFGERFHQLLPALRSIRPSPHDADTEVLPKTEEIVIEIRDGILSDDAAGFVIAAADSGKPVRWKNFPSEFGRYQVLRELGHGAMGAVFLAKDRKLERLVALKLPNLPQDERYLLRFYREAQAVAGLRHIGICPVYDVGEIDGVHHIAMAYIEGQTLGEYYASANATQEQVLKIICQVAQALSAAHRQGVIHRDLKPSNIMIQQDGRPVVMDFGLARKVDARETQLTSAGAIVGTPAFMAPEQVRAEIDKIGPATDIYTLGVIMYQLLADRMPYSGTLSTVLNHIVHRAPDPPSRHRAGIDTRLDAICMKAMSKRIEDRYQTMDELNQAITAFLRQPSSDSWTPATAREAEVVVEVIGLLDRFGWTEGISQMRDLAKDARGSQRARILSALLDWFKDSQIVSREQAKRWEALELNAWRLVGMAFDALHRRNFRKVQLLLRRAEECQATSETLKATIDHCHGILMGHRGELRASVTCLHKALEQAGRGHFLEGRILDSLGKAYASMNHFAAAREFYEHAIQAKRTWNDEAGLAVTHGQLGRLFLDWGDLEIAEQHFRIDLELAEQREDLRAMCLMFNHLGRVFLQRRLPDEALGYFDESLHLAIEHGYPIEEGFTRKDIALARLQTGDIAVALDHLQQADGIFAKRQFREGLAHVRWATALAAAAEGEHRRAERMLRESIAEFEGSGERSLAAQCWCDMAAVREARHASRRLVADALLKALERAEQSRRDWLVEQVEQELQRVAPAEHLRHAFRQSKGCELVNVTNAGAPSESSVMTLEILNPTSLIRSDASRTGINALNQLFFEVAPVLEQFGVAPFQYRYDGFEAICRGARHARRTVMCGLQLLAVLAEINRPRRVLELPEVHISVRISSGRMTIGTVGTYRKLDFVAAGMSTKLSARLPAIPDAVIVSEGTYELVKDLFAFEPASPQTIDLPGMGRHLLWVVVSAIGALESHGQLSVGGESGV